MHVHIRCERTHRATDPNPDHVTANVAEHAVDHVTNTADHRDHVTDQSGTADHRAANHVTSTAVARGVEVAPARARPMDATEVTAANLSNAPSLRVRTRHSLNHT
jgi:L-ascorbate metabolism protein UlaG (beta-lactamase superfamily)